MKPVTDLSPWRKVALLSWKPPHTASVYGFLEINAENALAYLEEYRCKYGTKVTFTHLVAKAVAMALEAFPELNRSIRWGRLYQREQVDLFLQVDIDGRELSGVKIQKASQKTLAEIGEELKQKALELRKGKDPSFGKSKGLLKKLPFFLLAPVLKLSDFLGNTLFLEIPFLGVPKDPFGSAMVSSLGKLGIEVGFANPPLFARTPVVVFVGEIRKRPWVVDNQVIPQRTAILAATFDHRIADGALIGKFARHVCESLESPSDEIFHKKG